MITEWFVSLATGFVAWLVATFPAWAVPDWLVSADGSFQTVVSMAVGMNAWVDMGLASAIVTTVLATWAICALIKVFMRAGSHVPGVGGAG